ncbi:heterokaryon incompatibility protein-domain-containing protein [Xylaria sp. FL0043]|nr:heterokaryon incompatibility protein-domain-containing protein [Xylaria sp. FL0043]
MADDLGDSLSTISEHHQRPLVSLLLHIQNCRRRHLKSAEFVQRLECLYLPRHTYIPGATVWPTRSGGVRQPTTFLRDTPIDALEEHDYVALSYTWDPPSQSEEEYGEYYVESRDGGILQSQVRNSVFERVIKYMVYFDLHRLWIDRECIQQEDGTKKETAVQAMDLVYSCSNHLIGLLSQPVMSITELELLAGLMKGQVIEPRAKSKTLEILEAIVGDFWWTRAWTYQENYRGCLYMKLLIPHRISSGDYSSNYIKLFGNIPGEIVVESTRFHEAATAFCLAFDPPPGLMAAKKIVLERACKFTLLLEKPSVRGHNLATSSMSPLIIADIEKRNLKSPADRIPIIANCCEYSIRLDGTKLLEKGYSISLAIMALFLLNGEILYNGPHNEARGSASNKVTDFLQAQAFHRYSPPQSAPGLTYNKSCRFVDVQLTGDGIKTLGHLWKLGRGIDTSKFPKKRPYVKDSGDLTRDERRNLMLLADKLDEYDLSDDIREYLDNSNASRRSFAKGYQQHMARELATAIREGRVVRLAVLWARSGEHSPYRGIFLCDRYKPYNSSEYVFTASCERQADSDRHLPNDIDRHVSLEVDFSLGNRGLPFLRTRRWIHGLCFFYGCPRIEVVFPWPRTIQHI